MSVINWSPLPLHYSTLSPKIHHKIINELLLGNPVLLNKKHLPVFTWIKSTMTLRPRPTNYPSLPSPNTPRKGMVPWKSTFSTCAPLDKFLLLRFSKTPIVSFSGFTTISWIITFLQGLMNFVELINFNYWSTVEGLFFITPKNNLLYSLFTLRFIIGTTIPQLSFICIKMCVYNYKTNLKTEFSLWCYNCKFSDI